MSGVVNVGVANVAQSIKSLKLEQQGSVDEFQRTECRRCVESGKEKANSKLSHLAKVECVAFQNAGQNPNFKLIFFCRASIKEVGDWGYFGCICPPCPG